MVDRHLFMSTFCSFWYKEGEGRNIPRIPPNRKTSNVSPSSGLSSLVALGSNKQTRDLSGYISSTDSGFAEKPGRAFNSSGSSRVGGMEVRKN